MKVAIVYHSGFGHTKMVARHIAQGAQHAAADVELLNVTEIHVKSDFLSDADAIVFGSPTYFGTVSAEFKRFMESTANIWYHQRWRNKLAAGFTNSSTRSGDKLNTLNTLSLFASQHSMLWIPLGILPTYDDNGNQRNTPNALASYSGLMTMSSNAHTHFGAPEDLATAEQFGERIGKIARALRETLKPELI